MFRLLATLAVMLLYVMHTQSSPTGTHSEPCDADACNKTCNKQYDGWNDNDVIGKCDKNKCRCYHLSLCDEEGCSDKCRQHHGSEINLRSNCKDGVCICGWDKKCVADECEAACAKIYAGKPNIEFECKNESCYCKWHGVVPKTGPASNATGERNGENKDFRLQGNDRFYLW